MTGSTEQSKATFLPHNREVSQENLSLWRLKKVIKTKKFVRGNEFGVFKYKDRSATLGTRSPVYERDAGDVLVYA